MPTPCRQRDVDVSKRRRIRDTKFVTQYKTSVSNKNRPEIVVVCMNSEIKKKIIGMYKNLIRTVPAVPSPYGFPGKIPFTRSAESRTFYSETLYPERRCSRAVRCCFEWLDLHSELVRAPRTARVENSFCVRVRYTRFSYRYYVAGQITFYTRMCIILNRIVCERECTCIIQQRVFVHDFK